MDQPLAQSAPAAADGGANVLAAGNPGAGPDRAGVVARAQLSGLPADDHRGVDARDSAGDLELDATEESTDLVRANTGYGIKFPSALRAGRGESYPIISIAKPLSEPVVNIKNRTLYDPLEDLTEIRSALNVALAFWSAAA